MGSVTDDKMAKLGGTGSVSDRELTAWGGSGSMADRESAVLGSTGSIGDRRMNFFGRAGSIQDRIRTFWRHGGSIPVAAANALAPTIGVVTTGAATVVNVPWTYPVERGLPVTQFFINIYRLGDNALLGGYIQTNPAATSFAASGLTTGESVFAVVWSATVDGIGGQSGFSNVVVVP